MPKKSWASVDQQNWLFAQLAEFRQAQDAKTTPSFFTKIYQQFHDEWPVDSPTTTEIADAEGSEEHAKTVKEKASESVSGWFRHIFMQLINIHVPANPLLVLQQEPRFKFRHFNPRCSESQKHITIAATLASFCKALWPRHEVEVRC
jgi:hypothetical protein